MPGVFGWLVVLTELMLGVVMCYFFLVVDLFVCLSVCCGTCVSRGWVDCVYGI